MKNIYTFLLFLLIYPFLADAQNIGIGTVSPSEKLEVAGNVKTNGLIISNGGNNYDHLMKSSTDGVVGFRKGHGALAIRFIICIQGIYPSAESGLTGEPFLGEIKMFAGNFAPLGWRFCEGQLLSISQNSSLFSLITFTYGGDGQTVFALPDLRGAAPLGTGTSAAGYSWAQGQKSN
jgi:microcystin-dependent protein